MLNRARSQPVNEVLPVRLIDIEPDTCCCGAWQNVTITRWQSRATGPATDRVSRVSAEIRGEYPQGISSVHLIVEGAPLPTPEGRAGLNTLMNAHASQLACVAVLIGGTGFWASAIRAMITGLRSMSSRAYELRLFGSVEEIVAWLPALHARRTAVELNPDELAQALHTANKWQADRPTEP